MSTWNASGRRASGATRRRWTTSRKTVTAITVDGVEATVENVNSGDYPITRILWMFTNGMPDPLERAFIEFVRGEEGQAIVEDFGYIPIG